MVEMGQIPAEQANGGMDSVPPSMQQQLLQQYGNGIYNTRGASGNSLDGSMHGNMNMFMNNGMNSGMSVNSSLGSLGRMGSIAASIGSGGSGSSYSSMFDSMQKTQMMMGRNNTAQHRNSMAQMPPPPMRTLSNGTNMNSMNSLSMNSMGGNNDMTILQSLSLEPQSIPSWTPSIGSIESLMTMSTGDVPHMVSRRNLSRQYSRNPSYGSHNNNHNSSNNHNVHTMQSITSNSSCSTSSNNNNNNNFSDFGMNVRSTDSNNAIEPNFLAEKIESFDRTEQSRLQQQMQQQQQLFGRNRDHALNGFNDNIINSNNMNDQRPTGPNGPSVNDRRRLFAKMKYGRANSPRSLSSQNIPDGMPDIHMVDSQFSLLSNLSTHGSKHRGQNIDMDISKHGLAKKDSMGSEYIGVGSRRSLMSGLSKLSGHSQDINNTFSNMAKKITSTNHTISSRSLTMSEFSGVDEEFAEDDFNFDIPTQTNP